MPKKRKRGRPRLGNINVHVCFEPDVHAWLKKQSKKESRPFSNIVNVALRRQIVADATKAA